MGFRLRPWRRPTLCRIVTISYFGPSGPQGFEPPLVEVSRPDGTDTTSQPRIRSVSDSIFGSGSQKKDPAGSKKVS